MQERKLSLQCFIDLVIWERKYVILCSMGVAAHTPWAIFVHSRFHPTSLAYDQGKFLTKAAQHRSHPKSVRDGEGWIGTHDPIVRYSV